jgi:hypothetical protein
MPILRLEELHIAVEIGTRLALAMRVLPLESDGWQWVGESVKIIAIDPGMTYSAMLTYDVDGIFPISWSYMENPDLLDFLDDDLTQFDALAVEMVASYGMAVGREVFETCVWIGRFIQVCRLEWHFVYRADVKLHLCHSRKAKDPNVRQALIDKWGPGKEVAIGKKATPGPLYGLSGDCWAALGVAVTAAETLEFRVNQ